MLDFPDNPSAGDQYSLGGLTWAFNGVGWVRVTAGGQVVRSFYLVSDLIQVVAESLPIEVSNDFSLVNYV